MTCNICGSKEFVEFRGRPNERCAQCRSLARHRVGVEVYKLFLPAEQYGSDCRVLHFAPEACLHDRLKEQFGSGYVTADASPHLYPHAQCLKMFLPDDLQMFPDGYFDAILHNHVLEHIPGTYKDHLQGFARVLKPGGPMIFSVPGPYLDRQTEEGGELLSSDSERLEKFLQEDHYKVFGKDFVEFLEAMPGGELLPDGITDELRQRISVRRGKAPYFVWRKSE